MQIRSVLTPGWVKDEEQIRSVLTPGWVKDEEQIRSVLTPGWVKDEEQEERQKEEREGRKRGNGQKKKIDNVFTCNNVCKPAWIPNAMHSHKRR